MAVTGTKTVRDLVTSALRKIKVTDIGETPSAEDAAYALEELNNMLKGWQNAGYHLWCVASQSLTLTTSAAHTLSPARPLEILSARFRETATGNEIPMLSMTRQEYDDLPLKTTTGTPTQYYYDRQREAAQFYVWPVLAAVSAQTVEITYTREIEDTTDLDDTVDVPAEWWEVVAYQLAVRLMDAYGKNLPRVDMMAQKLWDDAGAFDREASIFIGAEP